MLSSRFLDKERATQERWFRMKLHQKFGRQVKSVFLFRIHRRLGKEFRIKEKAINAAIETIVKQYRNTNEELFPATKKFFNIGLYFLLAERDIQALKADAFAHPNETKRNIALRALLLTVYEWDMGKVTGRRMNFIYETTGLSEKNKKAVVDSLKELKKARKQVEKKLSETRHNTIAHRDADAMRQYQIISDLEVMGFAPVLTEFYAASDKLLKAMISALYEIGTMESLFHQIVNREQRPNQ